MQEGASETPLARNIADALDTRVVATAAILAASFWATPRLGVEATLPVEDRDLVNGTFPPEGRGGERRHDEVAGLGDASLAVRVLLHRDRGDRGLLLTAAAGAVLPTGATRTDPLVGPTDATLQLGTGVVTPLVRVAGAAPLRSALRRIAFDGVATLPPYANQHGYRPGAALLGRAAYEQRLWLARVVLRGGGFASWQGHDRRSSFTIDNTGGGTAGVWARAGVSLDERWSVGVEARLPLYRTVNGVQVVEQGAVLASVSWAAPLW